MKSTVTLGIILALAATARADEAPSPAPEAAPAARSTNLLPGMPVFAPPPPPAPKPIDQPATDPDVLVLPKMTVKQKPRPRLNADIVYAQKDLGNLLAKQKFTQLDQALNKFTLPLFGQSIAERALEEHRREKKQALTEDVLNLSNAIKESDPEGAKALEKAITMP
jgi:hypothetical protein